MRVTDRNHTAEPYNGVAEFSYRVGVAVVIALVCMIIVALLRASGI
jgi:hypothetical protein